jgi:tetratricopeptide (TPR) repeat protein
MFERGRQQKIRTLAGAGWARRGRSCVLALVMAVSASPAAFADDKTSLDLARSVAVAGREAYNAGDYTTALDLFRRAYGIYPAPTLSLYEARSLVKLGRLQEADEALQRTLALPIDPAAPAQFGEAVETARQERRALSSRIPSLTVHIRGLAAGERGLRLSLNQQPLDANLVGRSFPIDPGAYSIEASTPEGLSDTVQIEVVEGRQVEAVLDLARPGPATAQVALAEAPPSGAGWQPALAYTALGLGVAGLATGVVTGVMAGSKHTEALELCPDERCPPGSKGEDALDSFRSLRTVSTVAYGVGAAGITAGLILWLSLPDAKADEVSTIQPWLTARSAGIQGVFR